MANLFQMVKLSVSVLIGITQGVDALKIGRMNSNFDPRATMLNGVQVGRRSRVVVPAGQSVNLGNALGSGPQTTATPQQLSGNLLRPGGGYTMQVQSGSGNTSGGGGAGSSGSGNGP